MNKVKDKLMSNEVVEASLAASLGVAATLYSVDLGKVIIFVGVLLLIFKLVKKLKSKS